MKSIASKLMTALLAIASVACASAARAADYNGRSPPPSARVSVVVDELFLRAGGCPRNPNCIAPRVVPINGGPTARGEGLVAITIPALPPPPAPFSFFGLN